ncbi:hypothetical protein C2G38_2032948 [Gigaspora rosea]|uniref:Uncharacterized protein n=1 Tax=Gigaspora rosea TaxID=44941 RepID=A0A397VMS4_9GLOM|nr:hypothetical protein C2G38_2032948 [Gigaspora rosea]
MDSNWEDKFENFEILLEWEKSTSTNNNKKLNYFRLVEIDSIVYYKVRTQTTKITFLLDLKYYKLLEDHMWHCRKQKTMNTYYIMTNIGKTIKLLHRMICPKWKMIDHINRNGLDNCEYNLRNTTPRENHLNCKKRKDNTLGHNGISFNKNNRAWRFVWQQNNKQKAKWLYITKKKTSEEAKKLAIEFKLAHDKISGNRNGYDVKIV